MKDENFIPGNGEITEEEKQALINWQMRITETGEIAPEPTVIQTASIGEIMYSGTMSNHEYHHSIRQFSGLPIKDILSAGKLKAARTPLHLKRELQNPSSPSMTLNFGSAFHSMILEPEKFEYRLMDDTEIIAALEAEGFKNPRATTKYKLWMTQFQDGVTGELLPNVLTKEAFQSMWALKKKLREDKVVIDLFEGSQAEQSIFIRFDYLKADDTWLTVKVRPDAIKLASRKDAENLKEYGVKFGDMLIISVKTTLDASPSGFLRQCIRLGYNLTEAFYYDVVTRWARHINLIGEENNVHTIFLTLEKEGNVMTGHYLIRPATQDFIQWGRMDYDKNLRAYINSIDLSEGYEAITGTTVIPISAPSRYV